MINSDSRSQTMKTMQILAMVLCLMVCFGSSAFAQDVKIQNVISAQIEAFKQDDVNTAFTFASPKIQMMFRSPENFGKMVQKGYPMVWRPASVTFLGQKMDGGAVLQEMRFIDADGAGHLFVYEMVNISGIWKINGVYKIKANYVLA